MSKICCFAGHNDILYDEELKVRVYNECERLIVQSNVRVFFAGNYGGFDKLAAVSVKKLKKKYFDIELNLILPYITQEINSYREMYYKNYDNIIIADIPEDTPVKYRIIKCNQYMVDMSDYMIAYVNYPFGGAVKTLNYANKAKNIEVINIGNLKNRVNF